jgi:hypothetical protein
MRFSGVALKSFCERKSLFANQGGESGEQKKMLSFERAEIY